MKTIDYYDTSEIVIDLLRRYAPSMVARNKGWEILCPFHQDSRPSCMVFPTGVFVCLSCHKTWAPAVGFAKLGVPAAVIQRHWGKTPERDVANFKPLPALRDMQPTVLPISKPVPPAIGVVSREPWRPGWRFRGIEPALLAEPDSPLAREFEPSLVRVWTRKGALRTAERYRRLALKLHPRHEIFLRLSTRQASKCLNSQGLDLRDPEVLPFGLSNWDLGKSQVLIVTEGGYDVLRCKQNLLQKSPEWYGRVQVTSLLGIGQWSAFLAKFELRFAPQFASRRLVLAFDNDAAGRALTQDAIRDLTARRFVLRPEQIAVLQFDAHDMGDLDYEGFWNSFGRLNIG